MLLISFCFFRVYLCSLLTLSRVISGLGQPNNGHINFRDSKLTRILQPSLSGNARMAIVCCATPSELYLEETRSTLQFAARAKLVKTRAQVNEILDDRAIIKRLQMELNQARKLAKGALPANFQEKEVKIKSLEEANAKALDQVENAKSDLINIKNLFLRSGGVLENISNNHEINQRKSSRRKSLDNAFVRVNSMSSKFKDPSDMFKVNNSRRRRSDGSFPVVSTLNSLSKSNTHDNNNDIFRQALLSKGDITRTLKSERDEDKARIDKLEQDVLQQIEENEKLVQRNNFVEARNIAILADCDATTVEKNQLEELCIKLEAEKKAKLEAEKKAKLAEQIRLQKVSTHKTHICVAKDYTFLNFTWL